MGAPTRWLGTDRGCFQPGVYRNQAQSWAWPGWGGTTKAEIQVGVAIPARHPLLCQRSWCPILFWARVATKLL